MSTSPDGISDETEVNLGETNISYLSDKPYKHPTASQWNIISHDSAPNHILAVHAGPGSGKTFTLVNRIAYMLRYQNLKPSEILVLSMANRSVSNLRAGLNAALEQEAVNGINISTFHSFCRSLVDQDESQYSKSFTRKRLMNDISWRNFSRIFLGRNVNVHGDTVYGNLSSKLLENVIGNIKSGELDINDAASQFKVSQKYIESIMEYLDKYGLMRYHDLITNALDLVKHSLSDGNIEKWIPLLANYKVIIIDEFQDMYAPLLKVIKSIAEYPTYGLPFGSMKHLTIAGDMNQCIFEFLGSNPNLMTTISKELYGASVTELLIEETFRLTPQILNFVKEVCITGTELHQMNIRAVKGAGHLPILHYHNSNHDEHIFIATEITRLICQLGGLLKPCDFAVLARSNKEVEDIRHILVDIFGFRCNKSSLAPSWINSKVHLLLDILNLLCKGDGSEFGLICILLLLDLKRGNYARVKKLLKMNTVDLGNPHSTLEDGMITELEALHERGKSKNGITKVYKLPDDLKILEDMATFLSSIKKERAVLSTKQNPYNIIESLYRILLSLPLLEYLNSPDSKEPRNVSEDDVSHYKDTLESNLKGFLRSLEIAYLSFIELDHEEIDFIDFFLKSYNEDVPLKDDGMINISTIHTAKGLEFPVVFVLGLSPFGSKMSMWDSVFDANHLSAAKARLFYVACTRAKNLLYIGTSVKEKDFSTTMNNLCTTSLPDVGCNEVNSQEVIKRFSKDLHRKLPSPKKLIDGKLLYESLTDEGLFYKKRKLQGSYRQVRKYCIQRQLCHFPKRFFPIK